MKNVNRNICLKRPSLLIALFINLILLVGIAGASGNEIISIDSLTMDADTTSNVQLYIGDAVDITGLSLDINYDPSLVEVLKVSGNNEVAGSSVNANINNDAGTVSIALINTETINSADPLPIINIVLHSKNGYGGITELSLDNVDITDTTFDIRSPKTVTNGNLVLEGDGFEKPVDEITEPEESKNVDNADNSVTETDATEMSASQNDESGLDQETISVVSETNGQNIQTAESSTPEVPGFEFVWAVMGLLILNYKKN